MTEVNAHPPAFPSVESGSKPSTARLRPGDEKIHEAATQSLERVVGHIYLEKPMSERSLAVKSLEETVAFLSQREDHLIDPMRASALEAALQLTQESDPATVEKTIADVLGFNAVAKAMTMLHPLPISEIGERRVVCGREVEILPEAKLVIIYNIDPEAKEKALKDVRQALGDEGLSEVNILALTSEQTQRVIESVAGNVPVLLRTFEARATATAREMEERAGQEEDLEELTMEDTEANTFATQSQQEVGSTSQRGVSPTPSVETPSTLEEQESPSPALQAMPLPVSVGKTPGERHVSFFNLERDEAILANPQQRRQVEHELTQRLAALKEDFHAVELPEERVKALLTARTISDEAVAHGWDVKNPFNYITVEGITIGGVHVTDEWCALDYVVDEEASRLPRVNSISP